MADENETFLDRSRALAELRGEGAPNDLAGHFACYGRERRIGILQNIQRDLKNGADAIQNTSETDLRKVADEWRTHQELMEMHNVLLQADR